MKLTDKQLRECAKGGHWCASENRPEMARQLLAARKALRAILKYADEHNDVWLGVAAADALKPPQEKAT